MYSSSEIDVMFESWTQILLTYSLILNTKIYLTWFMSYSLFIQPSRR